MGLVSFQLPDIGLRELHGTLSLDAEFLVFEVEDALVGEFDAERYVVKIEPKALADIRLEEGIIRDQICVRPKKRDLLAVMPGWYAEELPLTIWSIYRAPARQLVEAVQRRMRDAPVARGAGSLPAMR
jgi:hypothetical protein